MLVILIAALVGTTIVLGRYEPLTNGSVFGVRGARFRTVTAYSDQDAALFEYRDDDVATIQFGLRNGGRWPVRVNRLLNRDELDAETMKTPLQPIRVLSGPLITETRNIGPPGQYRTFRPFYLRAGEERLMAIQFRFEDCAGLDQGTVFLNDSYTVHYSTLWVDNEMEVKFPYNLVLKGPVKDCPAQG
jgi:hypothetical protein